jgi:hypothetical protein
MIDDGNQDGFQQSSHCRIWEFSDDCQINCGSPRYISRKTIYRVSAQNDAA